MSDYTGVRGRVWFRALTGQDSPLAGDPKSVLTADAPIGASRARFLCVVPDPQGRFPCARHGEVGLEEAYTLAARVHEVIEQGVPTQHRSSQAAFYRERIRALDPSRQFDPKDLRATWHAGVLAEAGK